MTRVAELIRKLLGRISRARGRNLLPRAARSKGDRAFVAGNNEFAIDLYGALRQHPGNVLVSPCSIRTALAMALAGAAGDTAEQLGEVLHCPAADPHALSDFAEHLARLKRSTGKHCELSIANAMWGQHDAPFRREFLDRISACFEGAINAADFRRAVEPARTAINGWVSERTSGRIGELIAPGGLDPLTCLVLVNAVYFKGKWKHPFDEHLTEEAPFFRPGGGQVMTPMMSRKEHFRYLQGDGFQAIDLEYRGDELSMLVLLPERTDGLPALETRLSARMLHDCVARMKTCEVELALPRFRNRWRAGLTDTLRELGLEHAFDPAGADFSGINGHRPPDMQALHISAVIHQATIEVNEAGTVSTAATVSEFRYLRAVPGFRANHPFLYAIRHRGSGDIVFLGRLSDPSKEG